MEGGDGERASERGREGEEGGFREEKKMARVRARITRITAHSTQRGALNTAA